MFPTQYAERGSLGFVLAPSTTASLIRCQASECFRRRLGEEMDACIELSCEPEAPVAQEEILGNAGI
jgi:hypothetical protein